MRKPLFALVLLLTTPAYAARSPAMSIYDYGTDLSGVLLSASAAARTTSFTLGLANNTVGGANYSKLRLEVSYSYGGAGITALTVTPYCRRAHGDSFARYTTRACEEGTCTVSPMVDSYTVAGASAVLIFEYDVAGCQAFQAVIAGTGSPNAADAITTGAVASVGE